MKRLYLFLLVAMANIYMFAQVTTTIGGLNYLLDSNDKTALVTVQSTSLSGAITIPSSLWWTGRVLLKMCICWRK